MLPWLLLYEGQIQNYFCYIRHALIQVQISIWDGNYHKLLLGYLLVNGPTIYGLRMETCPFSSFAVQHSLVEINIIFRCSFYCHFVGVKFITFFMVIALLDVIVNPFHDLCGFCVNYQPSTVLVMGYINLY